MNTGQWTLRGGLRDAVVSFAGVTRPDVLLVFGPRCDLEDGRLAAHLASRWPDACLLGCSTAGEITAAGAHDDLTVVTAVAFDRARARSAEVALGDDHAAAGRQLADALLAPDLRVVVVLAEGLHVDAQQLVDGLTRHLPPGVVVGGGLAGDGRAFGHTGVLTRSGFLDHHAVALGLYGDDLVARCASASGWRPFGLDRVVTRAAGRVVDEIDGVRALDVYARYLGEEAAGLPGSGLVYPVAVMAGEDGLIRSLSAIDREAGSLEFFGEVPEGSRIRLMHASNAELIAGAATASELARLADDRAPELALLFSCVGRKAVLGAATDLEVDAVVRALPPGTPLAGFHTYGEIGVFGATSACEHHNQTMTVLLLAEEARS